MKVLYLTYTGITEPLGRSQIVPYIADLARRGVGYHIISFEPFPLSLGIEREIRAEFEGLPVSLFFVERPRSGPRAYRAWILMVSMLRALRNGLSESFDLIHCRNAFAAELAIILGWWSKVPYLFDMRGFWGDARAETGAWRQTTLTGRALYRVWKWRRADLHQALGAYRRAD